MSAVAAPADRRFRRTHVRPSRTRRRWAGRVTPLFRYALAAVALSYGVYRGSGSVAHVLRVDRILVRGNERLSQGEVLAVLSGLRGESLVWTDLDRWRQRLGARDHGALVGRLKPYQHRRDIGLGEQAGEACQQ